MQTYETHKWSPHNRCHTGLFLLRPVHDARADAAWYADKGGSVPRLGDAVYQHHCSYLFATTRLVRNSPASPQRSSGKGQDGSDPLLFAAVSANGEGGVYQPVYHRLPPPFQGSLPSDLSLREGSEHVPQAGADAPEASPMKMRYPILISGGLCCSVWGFLYRPFPMPSDDPALDLVLYHTPNFYGWIVR